MFLMRHIIIYSDVANIVINSGYINLFDTILFSNIELCIKEKKNS